MSCKYRNVAPEVRTKFVHEPVKALLARDMKGVNPKSVRAIILDDAGAPQTRSLLDVGVRGVPFNEAPDMKFGMKGRNLHSDIMYKDAGRKYILGKFVAVIHDGCGDSRRVFREVRVAIDTAVGRGVDKLVIFANMVSRTKGAARYAVRARGRGPIILSGAFVIFKRLIISHLKGTGYGVTVENLPRYRQAAGRTQMTPAWVVITKQ